MIDSSINNRIYGRQLFWTISPRDVRLTGIASALESFEISNKKLALEKRISVGVGATLMEVTYAVGATRPASI
jgi:hypothetical protein